MLTMCTFNSEYHATRKVLSAAFFKQKLLSITKIIKKETIDVIKEFQQQGDHVIDIVEFWVDVQSRIFSSIAVGHNNANVLINFEQEDGSTKKNVISQLLRFIFKDMMNRIGNPFFSIFPELLPYAIFPSCRRLFHNIQSLRDGIRQIMDARLKGEAKGSIDGDLLSIFLQDPLYRDDPEKTIDDLLILFFAGNETIKTSSANTICFLAQHPGIKARVLAEITPSIEKAAGNFVEDLTVEETKDFTFLRYCWYEALRLEPPAPISIGSVFVKPVTIGGVQFDIDTVFSINFYAVQRDPKEWIRPEEFAPERFDPKSPMILRPDGKPRNPFAFCPFFGGKRICLGKTLAEFMIVFTLPLVLTHLDFEFENP